MSHREQLDFVQSVKDLLPHMFQNKRILEVGSLNINGTVRGLFSNCEYIGIDLEYGLGVDLVCQGQDLKFRDRFFDVSISCECFEHNPFWAETLVNMVRMTDGLVIVTCATEGRPEHGTTSTSINDSPFTEQWDYYKNLTIEDFRNTIDLESLFEWTFSSTNEETKDLYFWGATKPISRLL